MVTYLTRFSWRTVVLALLLAAATGLAWNLGPLGRLVFPIPYRNLVLRYAAENSLDPRLVAAVIKVESDFRPRATSSKGALGLMQVMPETGRWAAGVLGLSGYTEKTLFDPSTNIMIGSWYLARLRTRFGGTALAVAAYNAGDHKAGEWFPGDTSRYSDLRVVIGIPYRETRLFVQKVLFTYAAYRQLYNGDLDPQ